jgi:hypothetical protein
VFEDEEPAELAEHVIPLHHRRSVRTAALVLLIAAVSIFFWVRDYRRRNDPGWLFNRAVASCEDEYYSKAQALFEDIAARFPEHPLAPLARENAERIRKRREDRLRRLKEKDKSPEGTLELELPKGEDAP